MNTTALDRFLRESVLMKISKNLSENLILDHSLFQSGQSIYSLRNIGTHRLYTSLNRSAVIAAAAELLALTKNKVRFLAIREKI